MFNRARPICGSEKKKFIYDLKMKVPREYKITNYYKVVSCEFCGFCFADFDISKSDYDYYYEFYNVYSTRALKTNINNIFINDILKLLTKYANLEANILDVGAGKGELLKALKEKCFRNLVGLDPNISSVNKMKEIGLEAYQGNINNSKLKLNRKFDVIFITGVMEHLINPMYSIENIKTVLKDNGMIILNIPNFSFIHKSENLIPMHFHHEHINYFSRESIVEMMKNVNMEEIDFKENIFIKDVESFYYGVFQKNTNSKLEIKKDNKTDKKIISYLSKQESKMSKNYKIIEKIINSGEKYVIWGVGSLTFMLANNIKLNTDNLLAIVDGNEAKQGNLFLNTEIKNPEILKKLKEGYHILICTNSESYLSDIKNQILEMGILVTIVDFLN